MITTGVVRFIGFSLFPYFSFCNSTTMARPSPAGTNENPALLTIASAPLDYLSGMVTEAAEVRKPRHPYGILGAASPPKGITIGALVW
jgi:hypothetical protein